MKAQLQEFRPRDLGRILDTLPRSGHPTLEDIEDMARDTIAGCEDPSLQMVADAHLTINEILERKRGRSHDVP